MHHHCIVAVFIVFLMPYFLEQLLGADHLAPVLAQEPENVKLYGGECERDLVVNALMGRPVQEKPAEINDLPRLLPTVIVLGASHMIPTVSDLPKTTGNSLHAADTSGV